MLRSLLCWTMLLAGMATVGVLATFRRRHNRAAVAGICRSLARSLECDGVFHFSAQCGLLPLHVRRISSGVEPAV